MSKRGEKDIIRSVGMENDQRCRREDHKGNKGKEE